MCPAITSRRPESQPTAAARASPPPAPAAATPCAGECSHFCIPGAYNMWIWTLWRTILRVEEEIGGPPAEERVAPPFDISNVVDRKLSRVVSDAAEQSPFTQCFPAQFNVSGGGGGGVQVLDFNGAGSLLTDSTHKVELAKAAVANVPCRWGRSTACLLCLPCLPPLLIRIACTSASCAMPGVARPPACLPACPPASLDQSTRPQIRPHLHGWHAAARGCTFRRAHAYRTSMRC